MVIVCIIGLAPPQTNGKLTLFVLVLCILATRGRGLALRPGAARCCGNGRAYHGDRGVWPGQKRSSHVSIHLSSDSRLLHNDGAMEKRAAQRLARHLIAVGYRVRLRRHRTMTGAVYSVQFVAPRRARMVRK